jgi:mRNA-degrading endonuclease toxin of MazEF toxin-antitoxin module
MVIHEGLKRTSAVNLDHVQTIPRSALTQFVGSLQPSTCATYVARSIATGCAD